MFEKVFENSVNELILRIFMFIFVNLISSVAIFANLIVITCFIKYKKLRTYNNYYIISLSISDFMIGFFCIPFHTYSNSFKNGNWAFGTIYCHFWIFIAFISEITCSYTILAISFDRFISVVFPIRYRKLPLKMIVSTFLCFIWLISLINYILIFIFWPNLLSSINYSKNSTNYKCKTNLRNNIYSSMSLAIFEFFIPFVFISFFNACIYCNIRQRIDKNQSIYEKISQTFSRVTKSRKESEKGQSEFKY
jgi:hypothetical protein